MSLAHLRSEPSLRRHERELDQSDAFSAFIESHADDLMRSGADCDPFAPDNLQEAFAQCDSEQAAKLASQLRAGAIALAGALMSEMSRAYWQRIAITEAEKRHGKFFNS